MASSTIIGAAGEHYVMCQLLRRDLIAALAPTGVPNADIVVTDKVGDRLFAIQVKVRTDDGVRDAWHMQGKHEEILSPTLFYSFVDFGGSLTAQPKLLRLSHQKWLASPGVGGRRHNDTKNAAPPEMLRESWAATGIQLGLAGSVF